MSVESSFSTIADLNPDWPTGDEGLGEGDNHIRGIKQALKNTFPHLNAPVAVSDEKLNGFDGRLQALEQKDIFKSPAELSTSLDMNNHKIFAVQDGVGPQDAATINNVRALIRDLVYPVGALFLNVSNPANPASILGFGTWEPYAEGLALVGVGTHTDDAGQTWTWGAGEVYGEYEHQLTVDELPSHNHNDGAFNRLLTQDGTGTAAGVDNSAGEPKVSASGVIQAVGGNQRHNNTQPSVAIYIWRRTA